MDINAMMKQAKKMQAEIEKTQKQIEQKEFVVEKQGLKLVFKGNKTVQSIKIDEVLIDPDDKELLEDILIIAFNEGISKIIEEEESNRQKIGGQSRF